MRTLRRSIALVATLLAGSSLGVPVSTSMLASRSQPVCVNAPNIVAGTMSGRRDLVETTSNRLAPRHSTDTVLWCASGSETYVILTMTHSISGNGIQVLLNTAYNTVVDIIQTRGDGLLSAGGVVWTGTDGLTIEAANANNHQTSCGVMGAAIQALRDYMSSNGWGGATFNIYDGVNEVGAGVIGELANSGISGGII